jgi:aspartate ammonia-lyase
MRYRLERDPLGEVRVPARAYYGAQTRRAVDNFPISGLTMPPELIEATVLVKQAAAEANRALRRLDPAVARAIGQAGDEILAGRLRDQFVVDVYQAGAGTSHNMNVNEVLANRAEELLGGSRGQYTRVHPNDHVNMGQSTNDVFPTATRLALRTMLPGVLEAAGALADALAEKRREFAGVLKTGRTHLQDAVPMTLGQEFEGYSASVRQAAEELSRTADALLELNLGATALGTGLNAGDDYTRVALRHLSHATGLDVRPAASRFRVTQSMGDVLAFSAALRRLAVEVGKVASDLRLLSMGPRAGLAEIRLPAVQPGSSIMPGKVNPSVPEMVNQVCYQVFGCDAAILAAADAGQLELNVMMPVIAWNALHATRIMRQAMRVLRTRCVEGIVADVDRCRELLDRSTALATALSPYVGYAVTAEIAREAIASGVGIRELARRRGLLPDDELDRILSVEAMTTPGVAGDRKRRRAGRTSRGGPASKSRKTARSRENTGAQTDGRGAGHGARRRDAAGSGAPAQRAVPTRAARHARGTGPRRVAAPRPDHGRAAHRGGKRRR